MNSPSLFLDRMIFKGQKANLVQMNGLAFVLMVYYRALFVPCLFLACSPLPSNLNMHPLNPV